ncbi:hypothetical protein Bca4012_021510 [Brassica carinata]
MTGFSEDRNNNASQKRQRTSGGDSEGKKKRTATLDDLDAIECPLCFKPLTIPIFQLWNGFLNYLEFPCPNAELGCSEIISFAETSTHLKICAFTQRACPFSSCDFVCFNKDLYDHSVAKHCESAYMFECGEPVFIYPLNGKRVILKERTTEGEGEIVIVECFDTPQGRIFYASCIGPGEEELSYTFKLFSSCSDRLWFESVLKRVRHVTDEVPDEHFMLVPSCMCPDYKFYICIHRQTDEEDDE